MTNEPHVENHKTCVVNQTIDNEIYVLRPEPDTTVEGFEVFKNSKMQFLPRHIGKRFPNLLDFWASDCGLTIVRDFYFANMRNARSLFLAKNKIAMIETDSFKDLISVQWLSLSDNKIETLDGHIFASMVKLHELWLQNNEFHLLSPTTFKIPSGQLTYVHVTSNCTLKELRDYYGLDQLENY